MFLQQHQQQSAVFLQWPGSADLTVFCVDNFVSIISILFLHFRCDDVHFALTEFSFFVVILLFVQQQQQQSAVFLLWPGSSADFVLIARLSGNSNCWRENCFFKTIQLYTYIS
jgi:hypothetical protein